jgi:hypothetical protein
MTILLLLLALLAATEFAPWLGADTRDDCSWTRHC